MFDFNRFSKKSPIEEQPKNEVKKQHSGAYRTIISHHRAAAERLKDEPTAEIKPD